MRCLACQGLTPQQQQHDDHDDDEVSVSLVKETGGPSENHPPMVSITKNVISLIKVKRHPEATVPCPKLGTVIKDGGPGADPGGGGARGPCPPPPHTHTKRIAPPNSQARIQGGQEGLAPPRGGQEGLGPPLQNPGSAYGFLVRIVVWSI